MNIKRYFIPACVSLAIFAGVYFTRDTRGSVARQVKAEDSQPEEIWLPHGRVLHVVVEEAAVFVGEKPVRFEDFEMFLRDAGRELKPDYAIVVGTDLARYGRVVEVFTAIRKVLRVPGTMETIPARVGSRRPAIEVHDHFWEYGHIEEGPNQPPEPTALSVTICACAQLAPASTVAHL